MADNPAALRAHFNSTVNDNIITIDDLASMLGMPSAFAKLISAYNKEDIAVKSAKDPVYAHITAQEKLVFVPEGYNPADNAAARHKDFWLQIHVKGAEENPVMLLKFMDLGEGRLDMSSAQVTSIYNHGPLYYRPVLGHEAIENIEILIHNVLKKSLKIEPQMPPVPKTPLDFK